MEDDSIRAILLKAWEGAPAELTPRQKELNKRIAAARAVEASKMDKDKLSAIAKEQAKGRQSLIDTLNAERQRKYGS